MLLDVSLSELKKEVSLMARKVQEIFAKAALQIENSSPQDISEIRQMDKSIDEYEIQIDNHCKELLIKETYAIDFRYVFSMIKTIKELERIGDESKTIAKWSPKLGPNHHQDLNELISKTKEALDCSIEALINDQLDSAHKVMELEFHVDELEDRIIESTESIAEAFIAKALERIGDLANNIAENVIYTLKADDVRHGAYKKPE